jgi:nucleoside-diphosphate-sugar epimerase
VDLVTGATGFVGPHLVAALVARGRRVRCLVRDRSKAATLEGPGVEVRQGDLLDPALWSKGLEGVDRVFHLAGGGKVSTTTAEGLEGLRRANVAPIRALFAAVKGSGATRVVHFSSISAMGVQLGTTLDESSACKPATPHEIAKYESEQAALVGSAASGVPVVILRPSQIYGPGDLRSEIPKLVRLARRGLVPLFASGRGLMPWVYISDIVEAALLAGESARALGRIFIVSDAESYRFSAIVTAISAALGRRRGGVRIPWAAAWPAVALVQAAASLAGRDPPLTIHRLASMCGTRRVSIARAHTELGYTPRVGLEEGIARTVRWCIDRGLS